MSESNIGGSSGPEGGNMPERAANNTPVGYTSFRERLSRLIPSRFRTQNIQSPLRQEQSQSVASGNEIQADPDLLSGLGVRLSTWGASVKSVIERSKDHKPKENLDKADAMFIETGSGSVTDFFHKRVDQLLETHRKANSSDSGDVSTEEVVDLQGVPIVHLIYSRDVALGSSKEYPSPSKDRTVAPLRQACEASGWQGVITVDYSNPQDLEPVTENRQRHEGMDTIFQTLTEKTGKEAILIVDGFGQKAIEELSTDTSRFAMARDRGLIKNMWLRTSQEEVQAKGGHGSPWTQGWLIKVMGDGVYDYDSSDAPFDPARFESLVKGLDETIRRAEAGEQVGFQASNGYGKTTAFKAWDSLPLSERRQDIAIVQVTPDGYIRGRDVVVGINHSTKQSAAEVKRPGIKYVIVDEALRAEMPGAKAKIVLEDLVRQGIKVIPTYPGNVTPPEDLQIVTPKT